jgi:hypothetical protein
MYLAGAFLVKYYLGLALYLLMALHNCVGKICKNDFIVLFFEKLFLSCFFGLGLELFAG